MGYGPLLPAADALHNRHPRTFFDATLLSTAHLVLRTTFPSKQGKEARPTATGRAPHPLPLRFAQARLSPALRQAQREKGARATVRGSGAPPARFQVALGPRIVFSAASTCRQVCAPSL